MSASDRRRVILLSISALVACALCVLFVALTVAFPLFGLQPSFSWLIFVPPQAYLTALVAPATLVLAVITNVTVLGVSRRLRQRMWMVVFALLLAALALGPAYLIYSFGIGWDVFPKLPGIATPQDLHWEPDAWWSLAGASVGVIVVQEIMALVYAWRSRTPLSAVV